MANREQPLPMTPSRSRAPFFENPILDDEGNPWKGRALIVAADPKRGSENAWACTPTSTPGKANHRRQFLHGTPPRTRKRPGRKLLDSSSDIDAGRPLASGCGGSNIQSMDHDYNPASKSIACLFPAPCTLSSQHAQLSNCPSENVALEPDQDFWRDHSVQVIVRIRPLNIAETAANGTSTCLRQEGPQTLTWLGQPESRFTFDHVACPTTTQEQLFQVAGLPMVENCIKGYNSTIFAYGQTGSGKTHTMLGDIEDIDRKLSSNCGITPRIFEHLFNRVKMEEASHRTDHLIFTCKCSFLEIYNEQISDLLDPTSTNLQIHENPQKGIFVENLKEIEVRNVGDVTNLLLQGAANRRVAQTRMNQESSRSHSVFTCAIESQWVTDSVTRFRYRRLNLVDLAGSERQKASGSEGERLREAANINKSLSTLGLVIMILVDVAQGKQRHVPYRDSKLTFLLQDSLGGNSKTTIIATVSPAISCANETLSTIKFAQRAKFIQNNAVVNEDASGDVKALQLQIHNLKQELEQLRDQTQPSKPVPSAAIRHTQANDLRENAQMTDEIHPDFSERQKEENNELAAVNAQLSSLLEAYERDLEYAKTMLQLKEGKIQRLKQVEDAVLSAENCLQEENRALQHEVQLLKERLNTHPELQRFAFENKQLIQQLRCQEKDQKTHFERVGAISNSPQSIGDPTCINGFLEEGSQALDEALQQLQNMPRQNFFAQPTNLIQLDIIHKNDEETRCFLQQGFEMAKEIKGQFKVLCELTLGQNTQTTNESMQRSLAHWGGKCTRAFQSDATNKTVASGEHHNETNELGKGLSNCQQSLTKNSLPLEQNPDSKGTMKPHEAPSVERFATSYANDNLALANWPHNRQKSINFSIDVLHKWHKTGWEKLPNEQKRRKIVVDVDAHAKQQVHSLSIPDSKLALASLQELLLHIEGQKLLTQNDSAKGILEQIERQVKDISHKLEGENLGFNTLTENLQARKKQWTSQKIDLKRQILQLQSDAVAREKEISALQDEEQTLATIVDKLHKGEEGLTTRLLCLSQKLECSEKQRLRGEQLYSQTLQEIGDNNFQVKLKLQKLADGIKESSHNLMNVKKRMKTTLKHLRMAENTKITMNEASKACICTNADADLCDGDFRSSYQLTCQVQKQLIAMETEVKSVVTLLEGCLEDAADAWREEKATVHVELDKTKIDAAEKIGEASEALERFKHGQFIIREADLMVKTLTKAMESAREQQLTLMSQWREDKASLVSEINTLKCLVAQKEEELQLKDKASQQAFSNSTTASSFDRAATHSFVPEHEERTQFTPIASTDGENMNSLSAQEDNASNKHGKELLADLGRERGLERLKTRLHETNPHNCQSSNPLGRIENNTPIHQAQPDVSVEVPLVLQRYTGMLLEKLEGIVAILAQKQGGEDAWVRFLSSFALALSKLEEDANSCFNLSSVICETLDKTIAEKQHLQEELKRKQELLKGSFFDLSLLQESTADYLNVKNKLDILQAELDIKDEKLHKLETDYGMLENELIESTKRALSLEAVLLEADKIRASMTKESNEKIAYLETMLEERKKTKQKLGLEMLGMDSLTEQKMIHSFDKMQEELGLAAVEKQQLQAKLASFERQLETAQLSSDAGKRLADAAQQTVEASMRSIQEKAAEIENMESSIHELESTINALESQIEILKREAEQQQLSKEDLEMELHALRHQQYHDPLSYKEAQEQHSAEMMNLRQELAVKSSEIKSLTVQVKELMLAAEMQATAHHQKLISLEAMADKFDQEKGNLGMASPTAKKVGERYGRKCPTSPFKCISSGLAQQISVEIDEELYLNKCRIDELQDLAASRQREIFRLNRKLAEAEAMTYDVIRDLLGVKSDITTHALHFNHKEAEPSTRRASLQTKAALDKKELEALIDEYNEEKERWLEESGRRQAEVITAHFGMEKLRQKKFLLKEESKKLKTDLCKHKKRVLRLQEKLRASCGQGHHHQEELRRPHTLLLNHHELGWER